ncbi:MAG TPA: T9SS type A sorting domain-containing protein [Flavipsychrobacter sp.]
MLQRLLLPAVALLLAAGETHAQTPVWSTDIAPILFNNCASCHRPTGIAPFNLLTYNDAVNRASGIYSAVTSRYMPPWPPDPKFSRLAHERLLSDTDIKKIQDWVSGGKPEGDPNLAPPPPTFSPDGDLAGTPDMVTQIPTFTSNATTGDVYQCFVVPSGLTTEKFISAFEAIPGNREIVHHVLVYADTSGDCAALDALTLDPGYVSFGGVGSNSATLIGAWVPGTQPLQMPDSFGIRIAPNADIVIQIHYPAGSNGKIDSTKIKFYFSPLPANTVRPVRIDAVLNHQGAAFCTLTPNDGLVIPANQTKVYRQTSVISSFLPDITLLGVAPHMHLIGRSINAYGVHNGDTLKFIDIPSWDFSWQGFYLFRKMMKIPSGTTLYSEAFYDNTSNNPLNPSDPPQTVTAGEETTDEMMLTFFFWSYYQPGDENRYIDPSTPVAVGIKSQPAYTAEELFAPYPNPANNQLYIKYYLQSPIEVTFSLTDLQGRLIKEISDGTASSAGYHVERIDIADTPPGLYLLQMHTPERVLSQKVSVQH